MCRALAGENKMDRALRGHHGNNFTAMSAANNHNHQNKLMTTLEIKGDWKHHQGQIETEMGAPHGRRSPIFPKAKRDELIGRIQSGRGETREAWQTALKEFCSARAV